MSRQIHRIGPDRDSCGHRVCRSVDHRYRVRRRICHVSGNAILRKLPKPEPPRKGGKPAKKAKAAKKASGKATSEKPSERSNKKAEVIAMMRRAKGVTLAEICQAIGWRRPECGAL